MARLRPVAFGAAAEFPAAYQAVKAGLGCGEGPAVLGGSQGALVARQVATSDRVVTDWLTGVLRSGTSGRSS